MSKREAKDEEEEVDEAVTRVDDIWEQEKAVWKVDKQFRDEHDDSFRPRFAELKAVSHELVDLEIMLLMKGAAHSDTSAKLLAVGHQLVDLNGDLLMKRGVYSDGTVGKIKELKGLNKELKNAFAIESLTVHLEVVDLGGDRQKKRVLSDVNRVTKERIKELNALHTKLYKAFVDDRKPGNDEVRARNIARGLKYNFDAELKEIELGLGSDTKNLNKQAKSSDC